MANPSGSTTEPTKPSAKQHVEKQKELRFFKVLPTNNAKGSPIAYRFDVLAQLANIPARITLHELQRVSKSTGEVLREALADAKVFMAQIPAGPQEEDEEDYLHASHNAPTSPSRQMTCRSRGNMICNAPIPRIRGRHCNVYT